MSEFDPREGSASIVSVTEKVRPVQIGAPVIAAHFLGEKAAFVGAEETIALVDAAAFASKNRYNSALYLMRQQFIADQTVITYSERDKLMQPTEQYQALPAKVAQWVLR